MRWVGRTARMGAMGMHMGVWLESLGEGASWRAQALLGV
jgi:hypothetical protein